MWSSLQTCNGQNARKYGTCANDDQWGSLDCTEIRTRLLLERQCFWNSNPRSKGWATRDRKIRCWCNSSRTIESPRNGIRKSSGAILSSLKRSLSIMRQKRNHLNGKDSRRTTIEERAIKVGAMRRLIDLFDQEAVVHAGQKVRKKRSHL